MKTSKIDHQSNSRSRLPIFMGGVFLIIAGIVIGTMINDTPHVSGTSDGADLPQLYDANVLDIASYFSCSCGNCGDLELVSCTCPTAKKEKDFIKELIKKDYDKETIIKTVETMFGKRKV